MTQTASASWQVPPSASPDRYIDPNSRNIYDIDTVPRDKRMSLDYPFDVPHDDINIPTHDQPTFFRGV